MDVTREDALDEWTIGDRNEVFITAEMDVLLVQATDDLWVVTNEIGAPIPLLDPLKVRRQKTAQCSDGSC